MEKRKKCEDSCTCDPNFNELGVIIACPKQGLKKRNKDTAFVQITINQKKVLQYSGMLCQTWERLQCTGQLLKHSIGSTMC